MQRGGTESRETGEEREGAGAAKEKEQAESISSAREKRQEERRQKERFEEIKETCMIMTQEGLKKRPIS